VAHLLHTGMQSLPGSTGRHPAKADRRTIRSSENDAGM